METSHENIQSYLKFVAELPDIMPDEADEKLSAVYESVQSTLRVPIVNLIFRTLANFPDYFSTVWWQINPILNLQSFEEAADALRAEALLTFSNDSLDLSQTSDLSKLRAFNDSIHYVLPKLQLIVTALSEKGFGDKQSMENLEAYPKIDTHQAAGSSKAEMLNPDDVQGKVKEIFEAVKETHGHPLVSSYYRALGNWPHFLEEAWNNIKPLVDSQSFLQKKTQLIASATELVKELPNLALKETGERAETEKILKAFRYEFIPSMMIDVTMIKALLDGTEAARTSPLSLGSHAEWDH